MAENDRQISLAAGCLCSAHTYKTTILASSLPLAASCCHCNSCRRLTGAMYSVCTPWPGTVDLEGSGLVKYSMSERIDCFSCRTCASSVFVQIKMYPTVFAIGGVLDTDGLAHGEMAVKYGNHVWLGDTIDGGAAAWLERNADGSPIKRWREHRGQDSGQDWQPAADAASSKEAPERTKIGCHCGGVDFALRSAADLAGQPLPECVEPHTLRYRANLCACNACRRATGAEVAAWALVPLSHVDLGDGTTFPTTVQALKKAVDEGQESLGKLRYYKSSEEVEWYACSVCSANVFFASMKKPDLIDIAVGTLQSPGVGARMEGLLAWQYKRGIDFKGDAPEVSWRRRLLEMMEVSEAWKRGADEEEA